MGAFKGIRGRVMYVDMTEIHVPKWFMREVQKEAFKKHRALKKIDPFARCIGRRRTYETAEELKKACDKYFKDQECFIYDKWGQPITNPETGELVKSTRPLTVSGLARSIGVATETLRQYRIIAKSGTVPTDFAEVVTEALQKIEEYAEIRNYDKDGQKGAQFVMERAFGWQSRKEKSEIRLNKTNSQIALEKLQMQKEEHELKMQMIKSGLEDGEDNDIKITIKRAGRED